MLNTIQIAEDRTRNFTTLLSKVVYAYGYICNHSQYTDKSLYTIWELTPDFSKLEYGWNFKCGHKLELFFRQRRWDNSGFIFFEHDLDEPDDKNITIQLVERIEQIINVFTPKAKQINSVRYCQSPIHPAPVYLDFGERRIEIDPIEIVHRVNESWICQNCEEKLSLVYALSPPSQRETKKKRLNAKR